jgi:hypothetical protein
VTPEQFCPFWNDPEFQEAWTDWYEVSRRKRKSVFTPRAFNRHLNDLMTLSKGNLKQAIKILDRAVDGGKDGPWTKLHEVYEYPSPTQTGSVNSAARIPIEAQPWFKRDV